MIERSGPTDEVVHNRTRDATAVRVEAEAVREEPLPDHPRSAQGEIREAPPESFDALATRLNQQFDALAADVEHWRRDLDEAAEQLECLRHKLLDHGALRGRTGGSRVVNAP